MKQRSVLIWIIAALVVLIAVTLGLRQYMLHGLRSVSTDVGLARAEMQSFIGRDAALASQAGKDPASAGSLVAAERLRVLYAQPDIGAATLAAAQSDDPVI